MTLRLTLHLRCPSQSDDPQLKHENIKDSNDKNDDHVREKYGGEMKVKEEFKDVEISESAEDKEEEYYNSECIICLQPFEDCTVLPMCSHDFCFKCILLWNTQTRECPLCHQSIGDYLIHNIKSKYNYSRFYLPPSQGTSPPLTKQMIEEGKGEHNEVNEHDRLEQSIEKRRWVYRTGLYAKPIPSNAYTKYRPYPTPTQFTASKELLSRTTSFLQRELQVWEGLDIEFLTTFTISIMKSYDIRSERAIKLIAEFLDLDDESGELRNARHFCHEVYTYVCSPFRDLYVYDTVVQYGSESLNNTAPSDDTSRRSRLDEQEGENIKG